MASVRWQLPDGQLLKALREQAGLDPVVLARMGTMTLQQLRGLEDGEGGEFYSPAIKAHMGRALLAKLGHVGPTPSEVEAEAAAQAPAVVAAPEGAINPDPLPPPEPRASQAVRLRPRPVGVFAVLGTGLVAVATWAVIAFSPSPIRPGNSAPMADALQPAEPSRAPVAPEDPAVATAPASVAPPAPATAAAEAVCTVDEARQAVAYTPAEPRKAGNFVHLVADRPARLCVLDAARKATRLELEPGTARSVHGAAPFVVRGDLAHLRIFFQGVRVHGDLGAGTQVVLNEAPLR